MAGCDGPGRVVGAHLVEVGPHAGQHDAETQRHLEHGEVDDVHAAPALAPLLGCLQQW